jgi:hypothetical protein
MAMHHMRIGTGKTSLAVPIGATAGGSSDHLGRVSDHVQV